MDATKLKEAHEYWSILHPALEMHAKMNGVPPDVAGHGLIMAGVVMLLLSSHEMVTPATEGMHTYIAMCETLIEHQRPTEH